MTSAEGALIHSSPLGDFDVPDVLITDMVLRHVDALADKPAIVDAPTGRTITYGQLDESVRRFAGGLVARGFGPGDVLAVMAPNCPEYAIVFLGVAYAGGTITTVNPSYTEREVRHQLDDAQPSLMIVTSAFVDTARAAAEGGSVREFFLLDDAEGAPCFTELYGDALAAPVEVPLDAPVAIPYSSGTTGLSKGVVLTHRNLVVNVLQTVPPLDLVADDVVIAVLPFFHIYGMQVIMNVTFAVGGTIVTMPRFDLEGFLRAHQEHGITRSYVAPPIAVQLAKQPMVDDFDLSAVKQVFSGAAPLSAEVQQEIEARLGCKVEQGYGMTELSGASHVTPRTGCKQGSVGVTVPNAQTMIVDPATGQSLGFGVDGEVWVRGAMVMRGYLNNPEATAATIDDDGWLHTGDIGHVDDDGHLYIVDRLKELIKYKAWQVAPAELEAVLLTHPAVADAAVIGEPDDEAGEIPIGFVVLKADAVATDAEILSYVAGQVAGYKQLRKLTFIETVPKSPSGKILRRVLRDQR
ncbi:MAG TPA: 4-coumarate--CoA ligase family protein [Acidimicrobiia bacterium]|nr:4-coumarate--CoA ligase family protein [Acidimicrobiia bacterium]